MIQTYSNTKKQESRYQVIALGCSTGCPITIKNILSKLSKDFPLPLLVASHMLKGFAEKFIHVLSLAIPLDVKVVEKKEYLKGGTVYFAPEEKYMMVRHENDKLIVYIEKPDVDVNKCYFNNIDRLFESLALAVPGRAIGGVLTGIGSDGAKGLLRMKQANCFTFIQDKSTCIARGMQDAAYNLDASYSAIKADNISALLTMLSFVKQK